MGAALVGAAVELAGYRVEFSRDAETRQATLVRVKPSHILIDASDPAVRDDWSWGPALMTGARLYVFGAPDHIDGVQDVVAKHEAREIRMPVEIDALRALLTRRPSPKPHQVPTV
jgi:hypothetical protein